MFVNNCQERPVNPLVNVTYTCDRKKTKPCLLGNIISISEDPAQWQFQKGRSTLESKLYYSHGELITPLSKIESPQNIIDSLLLPYTSMIIISLSSLSLREEISSLREEISDLFVSRDDPLMS